MTTQTVPTFSEQALSLERQLADLQNRRGFLALDAQNDARARADLEDIEAQIVGVMRDRQRLALAVIEQDRRDAVARAQAAAEAAAAERVRLAAERLRKLACYALITAKTAALMTALDELGGLTGVEHLQVAEYMLGELTAHKVHPLGLSAPRRPLPTNEGV